MTLEYDDVASLAARLVQIPSENPPGEEADCAAFIHRWFDDRGVDAVLVDEPDPDRPQVAARVGSGEPTLVLNGHVDVVPAGDREAWTYDPYGGTVSDGRLYGRGSADMKTGLAIAMLQCHRYASTGALTDSSRASPEGTLVFHAAMGEETGEPGTRTLLERGYGGDHGIVLEPTSFRVGTSSKGLAVYEVRIAGSATHASHPEEGANPIAAAGRVLAAIDAYDEELRARGSGLCGTARASATEIESGVGSNYGVIPGEARLVLDRRIVPGEALADVDAEVRARFEAVAEETGLSIEAERVQHYASAAIPVDDPLARRLRDRSRAEADAPAEPWGIEAATDMRNFVEDADTPAIIWGPGSLDQAHTVDESIPIAEAELGYRLLAEVAEEYLAGEIE